MTSVQPSRQAIDAREALRGDASRAIERGFHLDPRSIAASSGEGVERVERIVAPAGRYDAGWALLFTGVLLMRGDDTGSVARGLTSDPMMQSGLTFASYLCSAAGDRLLGAEEQRAELTAAEAAWRPQAEAEAEIVRRRAAVEQVVAAALPGEAAPRLAASVIVRLEQELPGLDETAAGWALSAFGGWLSVAGPEVARAIGRSRVLGRPNQHAQNGCALGGGLVTSIGGALLAK